MNLIAGRPLVNIIATCIATAMLAFRAENGWMGQCVLVIWVILQQTLTIGSFAADKSMMISEVNYNRTIEDGEKIFVEFVCEEVSGENNLFL